MCKILILFVLAIARPNEGNYFYKPQQETMGEI